MGSSSAGSTRRRPPPGAAGSTSFSPPERGKATRSTAHPGPARRLLAVLADIGPPARHHELDDWCAAARAGLVGAQVDHETVLKAAADPVDVPEVIDRGALGVDPRP